ncbi:hypothetical protein KFE25_005676 [Diacronema lutheri]|uniref:SGNH hydrolase-type esterase domain-containing protein n=1 Tax=Diacronema lutheri TaxID=2081491 RepID=A0A8J5X9S5_DIALT|nr:hypothetical protein KFE25_005676 [Diacronema lutheri]
MEPRGAGVAIVCVGAAILVAVRIRARRRAHPGFVDGVGCASGEPYSLHARPIVLLLGDSITQLSFESHGWGAALAAAYARERRADVVNRGFSGYTSRLLSRVVPSVVGQLGQPLERVGLVTILVGSNDATRPGAAQHVPVDEYEANLSAIVAMLCATLPAARVVVITPPAVDEAKFCAVRESAGKGDGDGRCNARLRPYCEAAMAVAARHNVALFDLHARSLATPDWQHRLLADGLHLSGGGNKLLFEGLSELICTQLPDRSPGGMPWHLPRWNDVRAI